MCMGCLQTQNHIHESQKQGPKKWKNASCPSLKPSDGCESMGSVEPYTKNLKTAQSYHEIRVTTSWPEIYSIGPPYSKCVTAGDHTIVFLTLLERH